MERSQRWPKIHLNRSPQQQRYDYFRERQQQLDIEHMRKQDRQEFERKSGQKPCELTT